jgi:hypothetical protein
MTKQSYKEQITQSVLEQLDDVHSTFDSSYKSWWQNPRRDGGLRLTQAGDLSFRLAGLQFYDHTIDPSAWKGKSYYQFVMDLERKIKCPYYVSAGNSKAEHKPYIRLYDDRISMMLNLYGDLASYLDSVKVRR